MQTVLQLRAACQQLPGSAESFPFGPDTLVWKVGGKMYALLGLNSEPLTLSLKCDPLWAEALRREYPRIIPGYHLSKRHWNTLTLGGPPPGAGTEPGTSDQGIPDQEIPDVLVGELLAHSYALVVGSLTRAARAGLAG